MRNFRTLQDFVVTSGKNDYLKGAYCSVEHAETRGSGSGLGLNILSGSARMGVGLPIAQGSHHEI